MVSAPAPERGSSETLRTIRVVAAVVERGGRYLITQRREKAALPLLWEFPGGRVESGEDDHAALRREFRHRLNSDIEILRALSSVRHAYERYVVELVLYECALAPDSVIEACAVHAFAWAASDEFDKYPFTPADEASMSQLLGIYNDSVRPRSSRA